MTPKGRDDDAVNKVFGEELPDKTAEERRRDSERSAGDHEDWLRENVPPHHH